MLHGIKETKPVLDELKTYCWESFIYHQKGQNTPKQKLFEECEIALLELLSCSDAFICMCGDFNARTSDFVDDFLMTLEVILLQV